MVAVSAGVAQQLREAWHNEPPELWAQRLAIETLVNHVSPLGGVGLFPEQEPYLRALRDYRRVVAIKPRQVGFTTLATLFLFAKAYRSPHPRQVLQTTHDEDSRDRVRRMVEVAYTNLPAVLQFGARHNAKRTTFAHNNGGFRRVIAGKRGQGRSFTFSDFHATEAAFYSRRSSALAGSDTAADDDVFASVQAAMHDPEGHVIIESTGNGPTGPFPRFVQRAATGLHKEVALVFVPWSASPRYRRPVPEGFELSPLEVDLARNHGLSPEQLAWRRWKLEVEGYTEVRFRREYPLTLMDPFLLDESAWFNQIALNTMAGLVALESPTEENGLVVFLPFEEGRRYFIGGDTSGGVGRDEFVLHVLRDDGEHAAMFTSRWLHPENQALVVARVAELYGRALVLVEANHYGRDVIDRMVKLGVRAWKSDDGEDWYATGGRGAVGRKRQMMLHARAVIDAELTRVRDLGTILQMQSVVEKGSVKIEARGDGHDDRAIAYSLALWCLRRYSLSREKYDPAEEREAQRAAAVERLEQQFGVKLKR